ncbi:hypothetical protein M426DRAFT_323704 [Hypoxylon sp. CI-4A]|nr:hypothetical protein M426DRAFT_323704 [Hypoxylon sp. CI-4A]
MSTYSKLNYSHVVALPDWWYKVEFQDIFHHHGFILPKSLKIFETDEDWVDFKWAIHIQAANLEVRDVDAAFAAIMTEANSIAHSLGNSPRTIIDGRNQACRVSFGAIIEAARKRYAWTRPVADDVFPRIMKQLFRARLQYIHHTQVVGAPEADKGKEESVLALEIDKWLGVHPGERPTGNYARDPQQYIDYKVDKATQVSFPLPVSFQLNRSQDMCQESRYST